MIATARIVLSCALIMIIGSIAHSASISVSGAPDGSSSQINVAAQQTFDVYFLADSIPGGMAAYEFGFDAPADILWVQAQFPSGCDVCGPAGGNMILGLGQCTVVDAPFSLLRLTGIYFAQPASPQSICLRAHEPSSFSPPAPGYADCGPGIHIFDYDGACLGISVGPVGTQVMTFGAAKALY
jgi:hypothetical protein